MLIDIAVIILAIGAIYRGKDIGFARQICSLIGFFGGLMLGAYLQPHIISQVDTQTEKSLLALASTLVLGMLGLMGGEYIGIRLKRFSIKHRINHLDNILGMLAGAVSILFSIWLMAAILSSLPYPQLRADLQSSKIIAQLNSWFPNAPSVLSQLSKLIDPNGFPEVFAGKEPKPQNPVDLAKLGDFRPAVQADRASVVKLEGRGCGGLVEGSGFVAAADLVATNAHVVAGIQQPYVQDSNGTHRAKVVWFDPDLDFAVLRVGGLAGKPLQIADGVVANGTPAIVLGFPGGGAFRADPAAVLNHFTAIGRNIYGSGLVSRQVYELQANIIPGNSGGPLVAKGGEVIGVIFAESSTHKGIGYSLTSSQVKKTISRVSDKYSTVSTGSCAE